MLTSVDDKQIVLRLADGTTRGFLVRPQDATKLGIQHMAAHARSGDVGFLVYYETINGTDYAVSAHETEPLG